MTYDLSPNTAQAHPSLQDLMQVAAERAEPLEARVARLEARLSLAIYGGWALIVGLGCALIGTHAATMNQAVDMAAGAAVVLMGWASMLCLQGSRAKSSIAAIEMECAATLGMSQDEFRRASAAAMTFKRQAEMDIEEIFVHQRVAKAIAAVVCPG